MATRIQRTQAICDALLNRTATPAELDRIASAIADSAGRLGEYVAGTSAEKAAIFLQVVRKWFLDQIKSKEAAQAVKAAEVTSHNQVDNDFVEGV